MSSAVPCHLQNLCTEVRTGFQPDAASSAWLFLLVANWDILGILQLESFVFRLACRSYAHPGAAHVGSSLVAAACTTAGSDLDF